MYLFVSVFLSYVCVALIGNCDIYRDRPLVLIFFFSWAPKGWPGNPDIELTFADYFHLIRIVWSLINLALNSRSSVESVQALYTCSSNHFFFFTYSSIDIFTFLRHQQITMVRVNIRRGDLACRKCVLVISSQCIWYIVGHQLFQAHRIQNVYW